MKPQFNKISIWWSKKNDSRALATIGVLSNPDQKNIKIGKAGRSRWLGRRPHTRGVVKNPVDHPHGGGEGKSAGGRHPVSPTGQSAKGLKTRDNKELINLLFEEEIRERILNNGKSSLEGPFVEESLMKKLINTKQIQRKFQLKLGQENQQLSQILLV